MSDLPCNLSVNNISHEHEVTDERSNSVGQLDHSLQFGHVLY